MKILALLTAPLLFGVAAMAFFAGRLYQILNHQAPRNQEDAEQIARLDETLGGLFNEVDLLKEERDEAREIEFPTRPACIRDPEGAQP